jgi:hypothetical protein
MAPALPARLVPTLARWSGCAFGVWLGCHGLAADAFQDRVRPLLVTYCFDCHDDETQKGGVNLKEFGTAQSLLKNPRLWETAARQIEERSMPPRNKTQPSPAEFNQLVDALREVLDNPDPAWIPRDPGVRVVQRLSRTEYNHTVRDLLGVDSRPADRFPPDGGGGGGFDNNADTLFVPPVLMERYLSTAETLIAASPRGRREVAEPVWYTPEAWTVRRNLAAFAGRAYRRPVEAAELDRLVGLFEQARRRGASFELAQKIAQKAVLVSPRFLFRLEQDRVGEGPQRLDGYELASRLSYFLWSSMPDDVLLAAAGDGSLLAPGGVEAQVRRMLRDPKARELSRNFVGQWLGTRSLAQTASPNLERFPDYTVELREAMVEEPVAFFHALLQDQGSLLELLDSQHAFVNERLAKLYGLPAVRGEALQRVSLPDRRRGGLTGMAAVLTKTSYPLRTSPVLRGRWLLEEVLGTPPPPPPPLVPTLPADDRVREGRTLRQRLEEHRKKESCAACHARLDPMGFALENFDAIGRWRDKLDGKPIDASGVLPSGELVDGPVALKEALLRRKGLFLRHLTEKLLAYALGRGLEYYDVPQVKAILAEVEREQYRADALVLAVTRSLPFQYRRPAEVSVATAAAATPDPKP